MTPPVLVMAANYAHAAQWARGHGLRRRDDLHYIYDALDLRGCSGELVILDCAPRHRVNGLIEHAMEHFTIRWEYCG